VKTSTKWEVNAVLHRSKLLLVHGMCAELHPRSSQSAGEPGLPVLALATSIVHDPCVVTVEAIHRGRLVFCWFLDRDALLAATIPGWPRPGTDRDVTEPIRGLVTVARPGSDAGERLTIDRRTLFRFLVESTQLLPADRETTSVDPAADLTELLTSPGTGRFPS
jgi:hypothetical protein